MNSNNSTPTALPCWETPTLTPLGTLAKGFGEDGKCPPRHCWSGGSAADQCGNGSSARQDHCREGSGPPTGSCGTGFGGTD